VGNKSTDKSPEFICAKIDDYLLEGENNGEDIGLGYFTEMLCGLLNKKAIA
jgi:hypothetical protein